MKGHASETSTLGGDRKSGDGPCAAGSLQGVTFAMRGQFTPLMQCVGQGEDMMNKVYSVELALVLARFDPLISEEERRLFVHSFDSLLRLLFNNLHHFMDVENYLKENLLMILELEKRCREVEQLCSSYVRNVTSGSLRVVRRVPVPTTSTEATTIATTSPHETEGQQEEPGSRGTQPESRTSSDLQRVAQEDAGVALPSTANNEAISFSATSTESVAGASSCPSTTPLFSLSDCRKQVGRWGEDFIDLLMNPISGDDAVTFVDILQPQRKRSRKNISDSTVVDNSLKRRQSGPVHDEAGGTGVSRLHQMTLKATTATSNKAPLSDPPLQERSVTRRPTCVTEDKAEPVRVENRLRRLGSAKCSPASAFPSVSRSPNQLAAYLNILIEVLVNGGYPTIRSLGSSSSFAEEAEQRNDVTDVAPEQRCTWGTQSGEAPGPLTTIPSNTALNFLYTLFPSLRRYTHELMLFTENFLSEEHNIGGVNSTPLNESPYRSSSNMYRSGFLAANSNNSNFAGSGRSSDNPCDTPQTFGGAGTGGSETSGGLRPSDVVLFGLLQSLLNSGSSPSSTNSGAPGSWDMVIQDRFKSTPLQNDALLSCGPEAEGGGVSFLCGIRAELKRMSKEVQNAIFIAQSMQEQMREEATLLVFRVMTTVVDLLIPAVYPVDRRGLLFYYKWVSDMYRMLWEEDLLYRFSMIMGTPSLQGASESASVTRSPFSMSQISLQLPRKKRANAKGTLVPSVVKTVFSAVPVEVVGGAQADRGLSAQKGESRAFIVPGTVYSRLVRLKPQVSACDSDGQMSNFGDLLAAWSGGENLSSVDTGRGGYERIEHSAVLLAESLFEDMSAAAAPPRSCIVTRLVAGLLRGAMAPFHVCTPLERTTLGGTAASATSALSELQQHTAFRKATPSSRSQRSTTRKKTSQSQHVQGVVAPKTAHQSQSSADAKPAASQAIHCFSLYPNVISAEDIKALYMKTLLEAEVALSPLDPIRAAIVQNTVDCLVSVMQNPMEAYELLDAYLHDVSTEQIQPPVSRCVPLEGFQEGVGSTGSNPSTGVEATASTTALRRARHLSWDTVSTSGGSRVVGSHGSSSAHSKRANTAAEDLSITSKFPLVPTVIPSWDSQKESAQFVAVLALLRREHATLGLAVGAETSKHAAKGDVI
ncbi:hypothetical protein ERJ75_000937100 [Trypanosoma vivax]|uniref:Uncharacterized protein n=1 Tax=Trypanosoma vivax (strain Y486) TaxID=1055687 RepID=G0U478_TRYVY|nr:hypothetical protein TRVL_01917 [Trypanosoma vivax]KAH8612025.1 hypothetical protein ERJ75_000937100 [Trypanosoma vivax]CCC52241.1 conserved hypothetical protein [Trypanosoma vivax Y486]